ncbi:MAG: hypothetical protein PHQ12_10835 [Chthoniobacteraceae bacterium]|nr:hypothetical protein [Chthoniobacteraceae bacterium]
MPIAEEGGLAMRMGIKTKAEAVPELLFGDDFTSPRAEKISLAEHAPF